MLCYLGRRMELTQRTPAVDQHQQPADQEEQATDPAQDEARMAALQVWPGVITLFSSSNVPAHRKIPAVTRTSEWPPGVLPGRN